MTIALDPSWIADASMDAYSVQTDPSGNTSSTCISQTRFERFLAKLSDPTFGRLAQDGLLTSDGSLKPGAEFCAAYLICDLIQKGPVTDAGIKSEDFGGAYSYTKSDSAVSSGKSAFMLNYEAELATYRRGALACSGVVRSDCEIEFSKLSQGKIPHVSHR